MRNWLQNIKNFREKKALLEKEINIVEQLKSCLDNIDLNNYDLSEQFSEKELRCMAKRIMAEKIPVRQFLVEELCNIREIRYGGMRCLMSP